MFGAIPTQKNKEGWRETDKKRIDSISKIQKTPFEKARDFVKPFTNKLIPLIAAASLSMLGGSQANFDQAKQNNQLFDTAQNPVQEIVQETAQNTTENIQNNVVELSNTVRKDVDAVLSQIKLPSQGDILMEGKTMSEKADIILARMSQILQFIAGCSTFIKIATAKSAIKAINKDSMKSQSEEAMDLTGLVMQTAKDVQNLLTDPASRAVAMLNIADNSVDMLVKMGSMIKLWYINKGKENVKPKDILKDAGQSAKESLAFLKKRLESVKEVNPDVLANFVGVFEKKYSGEIKKFFALLQTEVTPEIAKKATQDLNKKFWEIMNLDVGEVADKSYKKFMDLPQATKLEVLGSGVFISYIMTLFIGGPIAAEIFNTIRDFFITIKDLIVKGRAPIQTHLADLSVSAFWATQKNLAYSIYGILQLSAVLTSFGIRGVKATGIVSKFKMLLAKNNNDQEKALQVLFKEIGISEIDLGGLSNQIDPKHQENSNNLKIRMPEPMSF